ncbi:MAG: hypothetical protein HQ575_05335, partial [Candidatus Omnitrophica bacterium]|nr:hypothetical protein [Candidatus Omnitrophota bacterium]
AIMQALELLKVAKSDIRLEDLKGKVLDLRSYTKEVETYRTALKELKRAL